MSEPLRDEDNIIVHFRKEVDINDLEELKGFLKDHYRYHTMNSWNQSTSYANRVKLTRLPLTREQENRAFELLDVEEFWDEINNLIHDWDCEHKFVWSAGFNGRSSGYIVLYQGGQHPDGRRFTLPGRSLDQGEDFEDWDLEMLQRRYKIVSEFDFLCDEILTSLVYYADNYDVKEKVISIPKTIKVLVEKTFPEGSPPYDAATATGMYDHDDTN